MSFRSPRFVSAAIFSVGVLMAAGLLASVLDFSTPLAVSAGFVAGAAASSAVDYLAGIENEVTA